jgi:hypothetical protein
MWRKGGAMKRRIMATAVLAAIVVPLVVLAGCGSAKTTPTVPQQLEGHCNNDRFCVSAADPDHQARDHGHLGKQRGCRPRAGRYRVRYRAYPAGAEREPYFHHGRDVPVQVHHPSNGDDGYDNGQLECNGQDYFAHHDDNAVKHEHAARLLSRTSGERRWQSDRVLTSPESGD